MQHLRVARNADPSKGVAAALVPALSTVEIYLDATTMLPVAIAFNAVPDNASTGPIAIEIDYSDYRQVSAAKIPFHIKQLISGGVAMDFQMSQALLNSGLSDSDFTIQ